MVFSIESCRVGGMAPTTSARVLQRGMVLLRMYVGLVFLSNGLAKLLGFSSVTIGTVFSGGLINSESAQRILQHASRATFIPPLGQLAVWIANDAYGVFGPLLTIAELALGLGMLTGVLVRWAAIGGLVLMVPVWVMLWPTHDYLWDYPADLVPLLIFAIAPVPSRAWLRLLRRVQGRRDSTGAEPQQRAQQHPPLQ